ncbi:MAG TPA: malate synthase A [Pseudonocardiaceae bacterium]
MTTSFTFTARGDLEVTGPVGERYDEILTEPALEFIRALCREFAPRRAELLEERRRRHEAGDLPDFNPETRHIREDPTWRVAKPAPGLVDRRVEITGPPDRKMSINALNSGAKVWMADFEDASSPTWTNVIEGQLNLKDAIAGTLGYVSPEGKVYALGDELATIVVRPRGWHLVERHITLDGSRVPGGLVDFGLFFFHNARTLIDQGAGPYFYLPKLESYREAELWNDVFCFAQDRLGIPRGTIRATVLIETITAAFQMEEILYALREHSAGLNAGRWDYIFSVIKNLGDRPDFVLPDRKAVSMTVPFMRAYTELLVRTCHKRGAHAIGGMAALIPSSDPDANRTAFEKVAEDKLREAGDGFDGSWVAHPGLVPVCRREFDAVLGERPNQLKKLREDVKVGAEDLLAVRFTPGQVTEAGVRGNVAVAVRYLNAWLSGSGAVALYGLMEDAATAEIARSQLWQWIHHGTPIAEGGVVTAEYVRGILDEQLAAVAEESGADAQRIAALRDLIEENSLGEHLPAFFTISAYARYLRP